MTVMMSGVNFILKFAPSLCKQFIILFGHGGCSFEANHFMDLKEYVNQLGY